MSNTKIIILLGGSVLPLLLCFFCIVVGFTGYSLIQQAEPIRVSPETAPVEIVTIPSPIPTKTTSALELNLKPTQTVFSHGEFSILPTATSELEPIPILQFKTLEILENTLVPSSDLVDLAERLNGTVGIPRTYEPPAQPYQIGDRRTFWVTNQDSNENFQVDASVEFITEHSYFWIENGVAFDSVDLQRLAETFENKIYPTNRAFFGSEWTPGVDNDPHLYILLASGLGNSLAGYFSSADEYLPLAHEYSNTVEMFMLNADKIRLDNPFTYGVLAHEFQHMIHWYQDRNESSWLNEGFSELAAFLNGYYESGFDWAYIQNPDLQLNDWPDSTPPHYGASFLFVTYFLDRFGEDATRALVTNPENGLTSVDSVLQEFSITNSLSGESILADDVFLDWAITNYIQDDTVADGRFAYQLYTNAPQANETEEIINCPLEQQERTVSQFGVDYIRFSCPGNFTIRFQGSGQVGVLPVGASSGKLAFWSNKGDESDMKLTRKFDFRNHSGKISLDFRAWYDLEKDYDYLYLLVSQDGKTWQFLKTPSGTSDDPIGNSFGWGYNGYSGGGDRAEWIQETVDLSQFAGQEVWIRFEYVTDATVNGEGFLLDDIAIPALGYFSDFEENDGGWVTEGWARIQNELPQTFRLALISSGDETSVEYLDLPDLHELEIPIKRGDREITLVVTATTRFTRQEATYRFEVVP